MRAAVEGLCHCVSAGSSEYRKRRSELRASWNQHSAVLQGNTPLERVETAAYKRAVCVTPLIGAHDVRRQAHTAPQCQDEVGTRCPELDRPHSFAAAFGSLFPGLCTDPLRNQRDVVYRVHVWSGSVGEAPAHVLFDARVEHKLLVAHSWVWMRPLALDLVPLCFLFE